MLIENQLVEVKVIGATLKHYRELGYNVNMSDIILVPPEHLTAGSHAIVDVICDKCKRLIKREYKKYLQYHTDNFDTCNKCKDVKAKQTCISKYGVSTHMLVPEIQEKQKTTVRDKYGVDYTSQLDWVKEKKKETCLKNFGVTNPMFSDEIKTRLEQTNIDRYGYKTPMQNKEIHSKAESTNLQKYNCKNPNQNPIVQLKTAQTCLDKYGTECVFQNENIKEQIKETNLQKYGAENPFAAQCIQKKIYETNILKYGTPYVSQNSDVQAKIRASLQENGTGKASKPQLAIFEMVKQKYPNAELNYPFGPFSLDIYLEANNEKINVEYNGWYWHQDKTKDNRRDGYMKHNYIKVLRINSGNLLPTEEQLFEAIDILLNTDQKYYEIILSDWKELEKEVCQCQEQSQVIV